MINGHSEPMEGYLSNSQAFVRALKAPSDPPAQDGPSKLEIAYAGWEREEFLVFNKEEVICEWLIGKLVKDRSLPQSVNPLLRPEYWRLLSYIVSTTASSQQNIRCTQFSSKDKKWPRVIASRFPLQHLVVSYLSSTPQVDPVLVSELDLLFENCFQVLWPIAVLRLTAENLLECYGALLLSLQTEARTSSTPMKFMIASICNAYEAGASTVVNKKKLATSFLSSHFKSWIDCVSVLRTTSASLALDDVYKAGIETMYHTDFVKQAAEGKIDDAFHAALSAASQASPILLANVIPRLLQSFVQANARSRTQLAAVTAYPPLNRSKQTQDSVMLIFGEYDDLLVNIKGSSTWAARTGMVDVLQQNALLVLNHPNTSSRLTSYISAAMDAIDHDDHSVEILKCLNTLASADIDIILPYVPRLFTTWASVDFRMDPYVQSIIQIIVEHYCKTRSVPAYLSQVMDAVSATNLDSPRDRYRLASASPLLSFVHCSLISKAVETHLTPGQVSDLALTMIEHIREGVSTMIEDNHPHGTAERASSLAPTIRIASLALAALPIDLLPRPTREEQMQVWAEAMFASFKQCLSHLSKTLRKGDSDLSWAWTVVGQAMIRLDYQLATAHRAWPQYSVRNRDKILGRLRKLYESEGLSPPLLILVCRSLLVMYRNDTSNLSSVLERAMSVMTKGLMVDATVTWSGSLDDSLSGEFMPEAVALLQVLLDRCLHVLHSPALLDFTRNLASIMLSLRLDTQNLEYDHMTASQAVLSACQRAEVWEVAPLRDAILTVSQDNTSVLSDVDLESLVASQRAGGKLASALRSVNVESIGVFEFLLVTPAESLTRSFATIMSRRALVLDILLEEKRITADNTFRWHGQLVLRSFLLRFVSLTDDTTMSKFVASHLMITMTKLPPGPRELVDLTESLLQTHFSIMLRQAQEHSDGLSIILGEMMTQLASSESRDVPTLAIVPWLQAVVDLDGLQMSAPLIDNAHQLFMTLCDLSNRQMGKLLHRSALDANARKVIQIHYLVLKAGKALSSATATGGYGLRLADQITGSSSSLSEEASDVHDVVFALLVEEWRARLAPMISFVHLFGTYLKLLSASAGSQAALEKVFCDLTKTLPVDLFHTSLDIIQKLLQTRHEDIGAMSLVISVAHHVLHNAPEGTTKVSQDFVGSCLQLFVNNTPIWVNQTATRSAALKLLSRYILDRTAALRSSDISNILVFASQCCTRSAAHDQSTSRSDFQTLVSITGTLVRSRRDLMINVLPHVGLLLRQFILCFRQQRPQLGAKQSRQVSDTLPIWISPADSLGVDEARALSRLIENLGTKTIVRIFAAPPSGTEAAATSLARPFSKHAASVIQAYVDTINDPLCTVSAGVRREMRPGLFMLCGMLGEHTRDAMMASSLDSSGKIIMKGLWHDYEKQRYVGKG